MYLSILFFIKIHIKTCIIFVLLCLNQSECRTRVSRDNNTEMATVLWEQDNHVENLLYDEDVA